MPLAGRQPGLIVPAESFSQVGRVDVSYINEFPYFVIIVYIW